MLDRVRSTSQDGVQDRAKILVDRFTNNMFYRFCVPPVDPSIKWQKIDTMGYLFRQYFSPGYTLGGLSIFSVITASCSNAMLSLMAAIPYVGTFLYYPLLVMSYPVALGLLLVLASVFILSCIYSLIVKPLTCLHFVKNINEIVTNVATSVAAITTRLPLETTSSQNIEPHRISWFSNYIRKSALAGAKNGIKETFFSRYGLLLTAGGLIGSVGLASHLSAATILIITQALAFIICLVYELFIKDIILDIHSTLQGIDTAIKNANKLALTLTKGTENFKRGVVIANNYVKNRANRWGHCIRDKMNILIKWTEKTTDYLTAVCVTGCSGRLNAKNVNDTIAKIEDARTARLKIMREQIERSRQLS